MTVVERGTASRGPATVGLDDALRALRASPGGDGAGPAPRLVAATCAAPALDPIALFAAARELDLEAALLVGPSDGLALVGIGRAWAAEASGPGRFQAAAAAWATLAGRARVAPEDLPRGVGPVLVGGLGFTGRPPADAAWAPFGALSLVLPELVFARTRGGAFVTAAIMTDGGPGDDAGDRSGDTAAPGRLARRWEHLAARASALAPAPGAVAARPVVHDLVVAAERPDRVRWDRTVGLYAGAVGRGRLDKVVLARRVEVAGPTQLDSVNALRRLAASAPESTLYAFGRGDRTFLGATPERLVRTEGREFATVAVAGSIRRGADAAEDAGLAARLLADEKEREEHGVVVEMLRASLAPIVERLEVGRSPAVLPLRHVSHLVTQVAGRLRERAGILALAERLHPTPAVGGEPRDLALELIDEHEGFDRGWYAGPVGWLGADGDGELVVALRCGNVAGRTAVLFAGCGIVADSDPEREWEESRAKLRTVASALGWLEP